MIVYDYPDPVGGHTAERVADVMRASAYAADFDTYNKQNIGDPIRVLMLDNNTTEHSYELVQAVLDAADLNAVSVAETAIVRKSDAEARLVALGSDNVRLAGLPDLSNIVADIIEALDLDL